MSTAPTHAPSLAGNSGSTGSGGERDGGHNEGHAHGDNNSVPHPNPQRLNNTMQDVEKTADGDNLAFSPQEGRMALTQGQRADLVARWSQPHRRYHTLDHLTAVLAALCDADLAILGSDPQGYQAYREAVRAEYAHVPDPLYREGRAQALRSLLGHSALFHTAYGRARWERRAKDNLADEILCLEQ